MELASDRRTMARGARTAADPGSEITALRQDLEQLRRSRDKLGDAIEEFVAELAHDIKNPIGAMRISVQGLKRSLENGKRLENEQLAERLARLEGSLNQMSDVIASARARLSGKTLPAPELCREAVDLLPFLGRVVDELCASTGQQRISLDHQCTSLVGLWDARALCSAVQKLIDNAVKFSPGGEKVSIQVRQLDNQQLAEIIVRDQGIGIPTSDLAHVCERFYRADNVIGRFKGAGLGLFEAKLTVNSHGGSLFIESREGVGTTCTIRLPLTDCPSGPTLAYASATR